MQTQFQDAVSAATHPPLLSKQAADPKLLPNRNSGAAPRYRVSRIDLVASCVRSVLLPERSIEQSGTHDPTRHTFMWEARGWWEHRRVR